MFETTTHIAGPLVRFRDIDRAIQRCAVCGEKLEDIRPSCTAVLSTRGDSSLPQFPQAHLVRVSGDEACKRFEVLGGAEVVGLPDDFCLRLVEE